LGLVLYGVATLLARVLPLWAGVGLIVALPIRFALVVIDPWGLTLFGVWWVVLGFVLWSRRKAVTEQPSRVRCSSANISLPVVGRMRPKGRSGIPQLDLEQGSGPRTKTPQPFDDGGLSHDGEAAGVNLSAC